MFIFNRPSAAVLIALAIPVLLALLDSLFNFGVSFQTP
jgi:hypothetical protein